MSRRRVRIAYHAEPEGWWASSPDLPGFSAAGRTLSEVVEQAHGGAEFFAGEPVDVQDVMPAGEAQDAARPKE